MRRVRWRLRWHPGSARRADPIRREAGRLLVRIAERGWRMNAGAGSGQIYAGLERLRYGARETWPAPDEVFRQARRLMRG
jgi:hypothetical protein